MSTIDLFFVPMLIFSIILSIISVFFGIVVFFGSIRITQAIFSILEAVIQDRSPKIIAYLNRTFNMNIPIDSKFLEEPK